MIPRPEDFAIRYKWTEGALPPPHHYEYTITLGPGPLGKIEFLPGYPMDAPPLWTETFPLSSQALDSLHAAALDKKILGRKWTEIQDPPVGGSLEWMEITSQGKTTLVPSLVEEAEILKDFYEAVQSQVPQPLWTALTARQEKYMSSQDL